MGVGRAPVLMQEAYGLHCWYSPVQEQAFTGEDSVRKAALEFHRFISLAFSSAAVLPFRFPTILDSEDELRDLLDEKAHWFASTLEKMEGLAQFEIRIARRASPEAAERPEDGKGMDEVKKGERAVIDKAGGLIRDLHRREMPRGVRLYLLAEKLMTSSLREAVKETILPEEVDVRLQGPWPPTEFLLDDNEL